MLVARATLITFYCFVFILFCLLVVLISLSVPVQVIDWKDSSLNPK